MELQLSEIVIRLAFAAIVGSLVGLERELHGTTAGLKTHALVCVGATIFTVASFQFAADSNGIDPSRIAAGIVTGIGFLGAGTIFMSKNKVHGLTTAANIWVVAALGLIIGIGEYYFALVAAIVIFIILLIGGILEKKVLHTKKD